MGSGAGSPGEESGCTTGLWEGGRWERPNLASRSLNGQAGDLGAILEKGAQEKEQVSGEKLRPVWVSE